MKSLKITFLLILLLMAACSGDASPSPGITPVVEQTSQVTYAAQTSIRANGVLLPIQQMELSFGAGGFVEMVEVRVGEMVREGQVLVRLDTTEVDLTIQQVEAELAAAQANYDLVAAGTPTAQHAAIATANLNLLIAQQALAAIHTDAGLAEALALQDMVDAQKAFKDAQRDLASLTSTADQASIDAVYANMILARDSLDKAKEAYEPWSHKPEDNTTRATLLSKLAQAQQVYDAAVRKYNGLVGNASPVDIAQAEANLALAGARLAKAQDTYQTLKNGPDPEEVTLAEAQVTNAKAQLNLAETGGPSAEQLTLAQAQVDVARANLELIRSQVDKMVITAPYDGIVSAVQAHSGEWATPGRVVVGVLDTSRWRIETKNVGELQIGQIEIGQVVQVSVNAFKGEDLKGRVVAISPVAIVQQGDTTYTLSIELEPTELNLWPGMTAQVEIQVEAP